MSGYDRPGQFEQSGPSVMVVPSRLPSDSATPRCAQRSRPWRDPFRRVPNPFQPSGAAARSTYLARPDPVMLSNRIIRSIGDWIATSAAAAVSAATVAGPARTPSARAQALALELERRRRALPRSPLFYSHPVHLVRGETVRGGHDRAAS